MQTQNRLLDDLARVASGALGVAAGMRGEIEERLREQFARILSQMDLVTREEFEVVKAMAAEARAEQERLAERVAALEAERKRSGAKSGGAKRAGGRSARASERGAETSDRAGPDDGDGD
ncbi:MAG TPA: accessory factor UbiK family protein [Kiloniellales bacterium]|nr:accessory factor UbiK family protein [Kiloniellales bacterium]